MHCLNAALDEVRFGQQCRLSVLPVLSLSRSLCRILPTGDKPSVSRWRKSLQSADPAHTQWFPAETQPHYLTATSADSEVAADCYGIDEFMF
ncbi:hypothetical protein J6590_075837 [Homalodisca vitripennis]|nr:hypothetical protein J6590_075837 [Homalodisca vitripennis]